MAEPQWVTHPGEHLAELLAERGISQADLARSTGWSPKHVNQIVKGHVPISIDFALALEEVLGPPSARFWLNLQLNYDLGIARGYEPLP